MRSRTFVGLQHKLRRTLDGCDRRNDGQVFVEATQVESRLQE